jgi:hypothetical protein
MSSRKLGTLMSTLCLSGVVCAQPCFVQHTLMDLSFASVLHVVDIDNDGDVDLLSDRWIALNDGESPPTFHFMAWPDSTFGGTIRPNL